MARRNWSDVEVEATVADYFQMLEAELRGEPFNKTDHRRLLKAQLVDRSDGAIELKHQNISAILIELGFPYIDGYKPRGNYQRRLREVVEERLAESSHLLAITESAVQAEVPRVPDIDDFLRVLDTAPRRKGSGPPFPSIREPGPDYGRVDYLRREALNRSLGTAGELFVLTFEKARLIHEGSPALADQIEHVARTQGDKVGYDVVSFDADGRERFIEVKTTRFGKETPFYVSRNQVGTSRVLREQYHLYRLFRFRVEPRMFTLSGSLSEICALDPVEFEARVQ